MDYDLDRWESRFWRNTAQKRRIKNAQNIYKPLIKNNLIYNSKTAFTNGPKSPNHGAKVGRPQQRTSKSRLSVDKVGVKSVARRSFF